ncbi:MAG: hypothetical protein JOY70_08415 [Acidisphaera sp.]|nr:hypothetical protein [Acidisphaera sp.]
MRLPSRFNWLQRRLDETYGKTGWPPPRGTYPPVNRRPAPTPPGAATASVAAPGAV